MFLVSHLKKVFIFLQLPLDSMAMEKSCGAIVVMKQKDGSVKYLLLHYEGGHWDFPKGNPEKNEKEEQTVHREIKEETDIEDIEILDGFKEAIKYFYKRGEETVYKEVIFFLAESATEIVKLSSEHIGYAWMSYGHARKKLTYNTSKDLLRKANQFLYKSA